MSETDLDRKWNDLLAEYEAATADYEANKIKWARWDKIASRLAFAAFIIGIVCAVAA